jgi:tetratricopeptide (TPR) repeat protein
LLAAQPKAASGESVQAARRLLAQGAREQAVRVLADAIRANPNDGRAQLLLGELLNEDDRPADAAVPLTAAVRLLPDSAEAHNALGEARNNQNALRPARAEFERALQLAPSMAQAHLNLGMVLAQMGELATAAEHLDRAIATLRGTPELALAHYLRAKVFTDQSEVDKASAELSLAVKLKPDFAEAWSDLGQARKMLHDAGALAAFQHAVALKPEDPVALTRLGAEYLHQGQVKLAIQHLEKAYGLDDRDQTTLNSLLAALRQDGQSERAQKVKQRLVEVLRERDLTTQNQLNATRINNEGAELEKSGDLRGAMEKYRQAFELDPTNVDIRVNYAVALLRLGEWKSGLQQMHEALRMRPDDGVLKAAWDDALRQAPPGAWEEPAAPRK